LYNLNHVRYFKRSVDKRNVSLKLWLSNKLHVRNVLSHEQIANAVWVVFRPNVNALIELSCPLRI
jgi:hypothetical protein